MVHDFRVREIALQAGLSLATVDRVLHDRPGVRRGTREQVQEAIAALERQRTQVRIGGRTYVVDVVVQSPVRFSSAVREAMEAQLLGLRPATVRARWHLREEGPGSDLAAVLDEIGARGSHGIVLKAPDLPEITAAVARLEKLGIPVVTFVTDLPTSRRQAHIGIDDRAAGATAAYLVDQWLRGRDGDILLTLSSGFFRGEEEREMGFRSFLRSAGRSRTLVEVNDGNGLDRLQFKLVAEALTRHPGIRAVYSIGGANRSTLEALDAAGMSVDVFIAHDLDGDNLDLLRRGRLSAVLHHDLGADLRTACQVILQVQGAITATPRPDRSPVQVITPSNIPANVVLAIR